MKIKDILAIVAVALTVGGCNQQDDGLRQDDRVPIKLRASVQDAAIGQTRATTTYTTQNTEFLADELVDAYIFKSDGTTPLATGTNPLGLKVTASFTDANSVLHEGDLEPVNSSEPKYYYPTDGSGVKIYAVHPSVTSTASFSVETDQTTDDKYAKSDLCYSPMGSYSAQTASQLLTFNHVLSKIVVNITNEINNNNLPTTVKLMAKKTTAMTYPTNTAPYYTLADASDPSTITMAMTTVGTTASGGVVIPPQSFAAGASFLSFTIPDIGPMIYPMPAATNFESGKRYTYNIKVTDVGITVSSSIEDWGTKPAAQTVLGKTVKLDLINGQVGDIFYSDGSNSSTPAGGYFSDRVPLGIIVYKNTANDATSNIITEKDSKAPGIGGHYLVMSLKNSPLTGGDVEWGPKTQLTGTYSEFTQMVAKNTDLFRADFGGYAKTQRMVQLGSAYEAANAAVNFVGAAALPDGTTGWFLPSVGQIDQAIRNLANNEQIVYYTSINITQLDNVCNSINSYMRNSGISSIYYDEIPDHTHSSIYYITSSSESSSSELAFVDFHYQYGVYFYALPKCDSQYQASFNVRPFLAF